MSNKNLLNYTNAPLIVWDAQYHITRVNQAFESLTGRSAAAVLGQSLELLLPPALAPKLLEQIRQTGNSEHWNNVEMPIVRLDGSVLPVQWNLTALFAPEGKTPVATIAQGQEIAERKAAEQQWRLTQFTMEQTIDEIYYIREDASFQYVNHAACQALEYKREELLAMKVSDIDPIYNAAVWHEHWQGLKQAGSRTFETRHRTRSGRVYPVEIRSNFIEHEDQAYICSICHDISEHKRQEEVRTFLAQTCGRTPLEPFFNSLARYLAHSLSMDFVCIDRLEGDGLTARTVAVWCDGHFEDNVTYALKDTPCGDVVSKTICCFPANVCQFFPRDQVLQDLRAESYAGVTLFGHTGQPIGLIAVISRVPLANRPQVETTLKMIAERVASELERQEAENTLRETNAYLANLLDYANAPIIVWDPQFRITRFNHAFETLTGRREAEVLGQSLELLFPPEFCEQSMANIRQTLSGERWEVVEIKIQHRAGAVRTVLWNSATLFTPDGKTPVATIAQGHDITKRKAAEAEVKLKNNELLQLNAEKDKFFSIIAHDLRSPFNSFLGLTRIMEEELSSLTMDEIQQITVGMRKSAESLYRFLGNLLDWARMQQGLIPFNPITVELKATIAESMTMLLDSATTKGIAVTCEIPEEIEVFADINMLQTVIRNLLSNALKFTPQGGQIVISAKIAAGQNIEILVKDSGIGMSSAILDNLFRIDVKTNRQGTDNEPSTGLGLLLCKEFIEKHGGKIWARSEAGEGSAFYFTLPGNAAPATKNLHKAAVAATDNADQIKPLKIVIAEDDARSTMLLKITVKELGREVIIVRNGVEAVAACRNNPDLDLVLMDIQMPELDGYAAARQIRDFNQQVVIIAQTACAMIGDKTKALAAGCNDYITKPYSRAALLALLKKYF